MILSDVIALFLAIPLLASPAIDASQAQNPPATQQTKESLAIVVLEGQNAVNSVTSRSATAPVVEVRDQDGRPVEGATVIFELPAIGPSGSFPGPQLKFTARSNYQGQAAAAGFVPNNETGRFVIKVAATLGDQAGSARITQTNSSRAEFVASPTEPTWWSRWRKWILIGAAGGSAGGVYAATRGGGNGSPSAAIPTITVTPGSPGFGGPR